jgi:hypothetical protein
LENKKPLSSDNHFSAFCHAYGGSETQDPRDAPLICTQEHAPEQGMVALHRPLHTPINPGLLCNCRAETVPAHKTAIARAAKSVVLIFLLMIALLSKQRAADAEASASGLFFRWLERPWVPDASSSGSTKDLADAGTVTRFGGAAGTRTRGEQAGFSLQLPGGHAAGAENGRNHGCQKCIFGCLAHDSLFLSVVMRATACCYFPAGATPASFVVQNAVNGVVKEHTQPAVAHGWVALHVPPQVNPLALLLSCRAETVPAQRTATAITASDRFWIFFFMA